MAARHSRQQHVLGWGVSFWSYASQKCLLSWDTNCSPKHEQGSQVVGMHPYPILSCLLAIHLDLGCASAQVQWNWLRSIHSWKSIIDKGGCTPGRRGNASEKSGWWTKHLSQHHTSCCLNISLATWVTWAVCFGCGSISRPHPSPTSLFDPYGFMILRSLGRVHDVSQWSIPGCRHDSRTTPWTMQVTWYGLDLQVMSRR